MKFVLKKGSTKTYTTEALVRYDKAFNKKVRSGEAVYGSSDTDLCNMYLSAEATFAAVRSRKRVEPQKKSDVDDPAQRVCWRWNFRQCNAGKMCKRDHVCYNTNCQGDHKATECPKSQKTSKDTYGPTKPSHVGSA